MEAEEFLSDCVTRVDALCARWFPVHERIQPQMLHSHLRIERPREIHASVILAVVMITVAATLIVLYCTR